MKKPQKIICEGLALERDHKASDCVYCMYNRGIEMVEEWLPTEEEIKGIIQLRYFKLMSPYITESDAEIVAEVLAKVIAERLK